MGPEDPEEPAVGIAGAGGEMRRQGAVLAVSALVAGAVIVGLAGSSSGRKVVRNAVGGVDRFFSWAELTASGAARRLGLDNTPTEEARRAMRVVVSYVLDPLRAKFGSRLRVTSGYRSPAVNRAVGGSERSQHLIGEAVDLVVEGLSAQQLVAEIVRMGLPFDQLIAYAPERGGHVHVSLTTRRRNRGKVLFAPAGGGYP